MPFPRVLQKLGTKAEKFGKRHRKDDQRETVLPAIGTRVTDNDSTNVPRNELPGRNDPGDSSSASDATRQEQLWSQAYIQFSERDENTKRLVDTYERILSHPKLHEPEFWSEPRRALQHLGTSERSFFSRSRRTARKRGETDVLIIDSLDDGLLETQNSFAALPAAERIQMMQKLAQQALGRMNKSLKTLGHMHDIAALASMSKDVVGTALSACPPASLAWAGVCAFILPVRDINFL